MRSVLLIIIFLICVVSLADAQPSLDNHLFWSAKGNRPNQSRGLSGLSYIGRLNDTIQHAVAVGEITGSFNGDVRRGIASLIFNRFPGDTTRQYEFPGQTVVRGSINGDSFPDFACWDKQGRRITVLFGTSNPVVFDTALVLQGDVNRNEFGRVSMIVDRCDSDQYDDLVIVDNLYQDSLPPNLIGGHMLFFRGGSVFSKKPDLELHGTSAFPLVGNLYTGHLHDSQHKLMLRFVGRSGAVDEPDLVRLYDMVQPQFSLQPADSLRLDVHDGGTVDQGIALVHAFSDSLEDIAITSGTNVLIYRAAPQIVETPAFILHRPFSTGTNAWDQIYELGDVTGHGYPSILVTEEYASLGGTDNGVVFLYNIGNGLQDKCVGYATGKEFGGEFGTTAVGIGDVSMDGRCEFMVAGDENSGPGGSGYFAVFLGDSSYGPVSAVRELGVSPVTAALSQSYPNPCRDAAIVVFDLASKYDVRLAVYDALGRIVATPVTEPMHGGRYAVNINTSKLAAGVYRYELACGPERLSRFMTVER